MTVDSPVNLQREGSAIERQNISVLIVGTIYQCIVLYCLAMDRNLDEGTLQISTNTWLEAGQSEGFFELFTANRKNCKKYYLSLKQ